VALLVGGALAGGSGCGGKSQQANGSGSGGASGRGGASATGGASGSGGAGGTAGIGAGGAGGASGSSGGTSAGVSGTAPGGSGGAAGTGDGGVNAVGGATGGAGTGAVAGVGGAGSGGGGGDGDAGFANQGPYPECETAADCQLESDCCGCRAISRRGTEFCALDCERDPCPEMGITPEDVTCMQGRCVLARSCDAGSVVCRVARPTCSEGTVPSVVDDCWGPCLPPTECSNVGSCSDCGEAFCVEFQVQSSIFNCVTRVGDCSRDNYCECLGVCGVCSATDDAVACPCTGC
jgi:hypothetical protein